MKVSRRQFLRSASAAGAALTLRPDSAPSLARPLDRAAFGFPDPARHWHGDSSVAAALRAYGRVSAPAGHGPAMAPHGPAEAGPYLQPQKQKPTRAPGDEEAPKQPPASLAARFPDLPRHFVFEYYPWYAVNPYRHWEASERKPPVDVASNYMPRLGAYDSRSAAVMAQHATWMADAGVGAINVSWWGRDSDTDLVVPTLMDVMSAHGIHVAFHLEPYTDAHALNYARDVQYLVTQYGDRRRWDCFLLLQHAGGAIGPVFKSFRTILPPQSTDCHGVTTAVPDYASDAVWHDQTDRVRKLLAGDFDRVTLLADSLDYKRTQAGGFDGIAVYDNFVEPDMWPSHAQHCTERGLLFSFNINPGYDGIEPRHVDPRSCYSPLPFEPGKAKYDWSRAGDRQAAAAASQARIAESLQTTLALQTDPTLTNARRGFLLAYLTSFNEWHEGTQYEPMKNHADLSDEERAVGYHDPDNGNYRLSALRALLAGVMTPRM
jgi:hypothetical protein